MVAPWTSTLPWHLSQQLTNFWSMQMNQLTLGRLMADCWLSIDRSRCQLQVKQGYWLTLNRRYRKYTSRSLLSKIKWKITFGDPILPLCEPMERLLIWILQNKNWNWNLLETRRFKTNSRVYQGVKKDKMMTGFPKWREQGERGN